ncbi:MAG: hypothetical protein AB1646_03635 [Thermodesulfobacteriota bacterium]
MNLPDNCRCVGIVGDGPTDRQVVERLVTCLLSDLGGEVLIFHYLDELTLHDDMDRFFRKASKQSDYSLSDEPAQRLRSAAFDLLLTGVGMLQQRLDRSLSNLDVLVLHCDAESFLKSPDQHFSEPWALAAVVSVHNGIEWFYHTQSEQYVPNECVPLIVPLVMFPSTEIIVAAAKTPMGVSFRSRGKSAADLKLDLYNEADLRNLSKQEFEQLVLQHITVDACGSIYRHVPETRAFFRVLSWNRGCIPSTG